MRDILTDLQHWLAEDRPVALATVVGTWGSSPRAAGSKMAVTADGRVAGSVSGGCVESAVVEAGRQTLKTRQPQLLHFGIADETAWEVGLACGGSLDIFVSSLNKVFFAELRSVLESDESAVMATVVRGPKDLLGGQLLVRADGSVAGSLGQGWDEKIRPLALEVLEQDLSRRVQLDEEIEVFFEGILPPPTLIVVGGAHIALALTSLAKIVGYRTALIDPRRAWGNRERFPHVDQLFQAWPEEAFAQLDLTASTAITTLTHDPKLDDPALKIALSSPAFYVGALGSVRTNANRRERLLRDGLREAQLSRLHAPIGLDIGAQSPEEIALAVMAQVVEAYRKREQAPVEMEANTRLRD